MLIIRATQTSMFGTIWTNCNLGDSSSLLWQDPEESAENTITPDGACPRLANALS